MTEPEAVAVAEFQKEMTEVVIPEIVRTMQMRHVAAAASRQWIILS